MFFNPIEGRESWINKVAQYGYRLNEICGFDLLYKFEKSNKKYSYVVQYISHMSNIQRQEYEEFLIEAGFRFWNVSFNFLQFSVGRIKLRPYANREGLFATSGGMINKEILIIEGNSENTPLNLFSDLGSYLQSLRKRRRKYIYLFLVWLSIVMGLVKLGGKGFFVSTPIGIILIVLSFIYIVYFIFMLSKLILDKKDEVIINE